MTTKDSHTKTWVWVTAFPQGQTELFGWSPLGIQDRMIYGQDSSFSFFFFFLSIWKTSRQLVAPSPVQRSTKYIKEQKPADQEQGNNKCSMYPLRAKLYF